MTPISNDLTDLANAFGSDKGDAAFNKHHYTRAYMEYFRDLRLEPVELCEIGLLHPSAKLTAAGSYDCTPSLSMWAQFFPNGRITGFDIDNFSAVKDPRLRILRGDQERREDLAKLALPGGGLYDIIIDDGSHASHHQQITLGVLFKFLRPGGLYFIEDLAWQPQELEPAGAPKTLAVLEQLKFHGKLESPYMLEEERRYVLDQVEKIVFYDSMYLPSFTDSLAVLVKK